MRTRSELAVVMFVIRVIGCTSPRFSKVGFIETAGPGGVISACQIAFGVGIVPINPQDRFDYRFLRLPENGPQQGLLPHHLDAGLGREDGFKGLETTDLLTVPFGGAVTVRVTVTDHDPPHDVEYDHTQTFQCPAVQSPPDAPPPP
jgi:hypothetical protein